MFSSVMSSCDVMVILICCFVAATCDASFTGWTEPKIESVSGSGNVTLYENQPIGATDILFTVKEVTGSVKYKIAASDNFTLGNTGRLYLTTPLDYEVMDTYVFEVIATTGYDDSSSKVTSATATVTVNVNDVNNPPTFTASSYGVCVPDGTDSGTNVMQVEAVGDTPLISYSITAGDTYGDFVIDNSTGLITVAPDKLLNASKTRGYALRIKVKDDAEESPHAVKAVTTAAIVVADRKCSTASMLNSGAVTYIMTQMLFLLI